MKKLVDIQEMILALIKSFSEEQGTFRRNIVKALNCAGFSYVEIHKELQEMENIGVIEGFELNKEGYDYPVTFYKIISNAG